MKRTILFFTFTASILFLGQCGVGPVGALLFTNNKFAGQVNPNNDVGTTRVGEGCMHQVLGLASWGNAGAGNIAQSNGISRIATIDHSALNVLMFVYSQYCTIVTGE